MGCGGSKPQEADAPASTGPSEAQKEAQRKFKEAQAKLEAEKAEKKRQSLDAAQLAEVAKQQEALVEAETAQQEANEQNTAAIASQIAADMAEKQIEEARQADEARKEEEQKNVMESFKGMGAKLRFRAAMDKGLTQEARDAAACMLQGAWRAKCARRAVAEKKAEKKRLMESGMARKIQSLYRCRQARRKAAAKKEEKRRILAEEEERKAAAAIELAAQEAAVVAQEEKAAAAAAEAEAASKEAEQKEVEQKEEADKAAAAAAAAAATAASAAAAVSTADVNVTVPPAMKTGMIRKEGSMVKSWKTRHFVLRSMGERTSRLTYYEGPKTTEPFGTDEKGTQVINKDTKITNGTDTMLTLVFADGKNLKLEFLKGSDKTSWQHAFEEHIAYCK